MSFTYLGHCRRPAPYEEGRSGRSVTARAPLLPLDVLRQQFGRNDDRDEHRRGASHLHPSPWHLKIIPFPNQLETKPGRYYVVGRGFVLDAQQEVNARRTVVHAPSFSSNTPSQPSVRPDSLQDGARSS